LSANEPLRRLLLMLPRTTISFVRTSSASPSNSKKTLSTMTMTAIMPRDTNNDRQFFIKALKHCRRLERDVLLMLLLLFLVLLLLVVLSSLEIIPHFAVDVYTFS